MVLAMWKRGHFPVLLVMFILILKPSFTGILLTVALNASVYIGQNSKLKFSTPNSKYLSQHYCRRKKLPSMKDQETQTDEPELTEEKN